MTDSKSKPMSNTKRAVNMLREMIFAGHLPASSQHLEKELAEKLNMSRTPVREAAMILESQGLVKVVPRHGIRVLPISVDDMEEVYDIIGELESHAAEVAARRGYSADALCVLETSLTNMEAALARNDLDGWATADNEFHSELVRLGGNQRLIGIVAMMSDQVRRARLATLRIRPFPTQSLEDHKAVFDAIAAGDATTARQLHSAHRINSKRVIINSLRRHEIPLL